MIRNNVHHLPVLRGRAPARGPHEPRPDDAPGDLADLGRPRDRGPAGPGRALPRRRAVDGMISVLLEDGAGAGNLTRVITEINDRLVRKVLEWSEGSSGRRRRLVLDRLRQRGAARADLQDRPGQCARLRRPGRRGAGAPAREWFAASHRRSATHSRAAASRPARGATWPPTRSGAGLCATGNAPSPPGCEPRRGGGAALADPLRLSPASRCERSRRAAARAPAAAIARAPAFLGFWRIRSRGTRRRSAFCTVSSSKRRASTKIISISS